MARRVQCFNQDWSETMADQWLHLLRLHPVPYRVTLPLQHWYRGGLRRQIFSLRSLLPIISASPFHGWLPLLWVQTSLLHRVKQVQISKMNESYQHQISLFQNILWFSWSVWWQDKCLLLHCDSPPVLGPRDYVLDDDDDAIQSNTLLQPSVNYILVETNLVETFTVFSSMRMLNNVVQNKDYSFDNFL